MATARVGRLPETSPRRGGSVRERHLRVVRSPRAGLHIGLSPRAGVVLTVAVFAALFGVAVSHALLIESQATVDELNQTVAAEQARYERLRLDVAELESPQRITAEAQDRLGMVPAGEVVWLTPDEPAPAVDSGDDPPPESPDTSAARVKPYLEAPS
jgi:cell division protein FtsL